MRFLHLADLHLGKLLHSLSLTESGDQPYWVGQILEYVSREKPDAVLIAGDVYDRGVPALKAIPLLSQLLTGISESGIPVLLIAGNHDGGSRLEVCPELLRRQNVYIAGTLRKELLHASVDPGDGFGPVTFWLMPYVYPALVRQVLELPEDEVPTCTEAVRKLLQAQQIDFSRRNVLIAHQTVLYGGNEPQHSPSETAYGGVSGIDASVFDGFDYVALGHIHGMQKVGTERIRYAGSPLCYHFSEAGQRKGPLMITLGGKDELPKAELTVLEPLHRVRPTMRGKLADIIAGEQNSTAHNEYVRVELTDEWVEPDTHDKLKALFASHRCELMELVRTPERMGSSSQDGAGVRMEELSLSDIFLEFYRGRTGQDDPPRDELDLIRYAAGQIGSGMDPDQMADALAKYAMAREVGVN